MPTYKTYYLRVNNIIVTCFTSCRMGTSKKYNHFVLIRYDKTTDKEHYLATFDLDKMRETNTKLTI